VLVVAVAIALGSGRTPRLDVARAEHESQLPQATVALDAANAAAAANGVNGTPTYLVGRAAGYVGLAYWYFFSPIHHIVVSAMLRGIRRWAHGVLTPLDCNLQGEYIRLCLSAKSRGASRRQGFMDSGNRHRMVHVRAPLTYSRRAARPRRAASRTLLAATGRFNRGSNSCVGCRR
jgi:hypothetical protein